MYGESSICKRDRRFLAKWNLCFCEAKRMIKEPSFGGLFVGFPNNSALFSPVPLDVDAIKLFSIPDDLFDEQEPAIEKTFFPALIKYLQKSPDFEAMPSRQNPTNPTQNIVLFRRKPAP